MNNKVSTRRITTLSLTLAAAVVFGAVEAWLPPIIPIPGVKLGVSNIAIVCALYMFGLRDALLISSMRVLIVTFMFASLSALPFSFIGAVVSLVVMAATRRVFTIRGVSAVGGITHNAAQLALAVVIYDNAALISYFPYMVAIGCLTGFAVGHAAGALVKLSGR